MTGALPPRDTRWSLAVWVVSIAAVVRGVFAALLPAFPDEAYYWSWSRHLADGYFDHPPIGALLIRFGDGVLGVFGLSNTPIAIRVGTIVVGWLAALATIATARRLAGDAAALRASVILSVLPLAAAGLVLATPDAPVLAAIAATLYCVVRALESAVGSAASTRWWTLAGIALGLGFDSKYTSIFVPVAVVLAVAARPELRARLREPGPYIACVVATLLFVPVLAWNARHGWTSFRFQLHHGLSAPSGSALLAAWHHEGDLFGGQAGLASPILFVMLGMAVWRGLVGSDARGARFVLAVVSAFSFAFFVYSAVRQRVEPNWPSPAYIPAVILLAALPLSARGQRWLNAGVVLGAVLSLAIYAQAIAPVLPIAPPKDPIARAFGWDDASRRARAAADAASAASHSSTWMGGDRYQEAAELALHDSLGRRTFATNLAGRPNEYDLWPRFPDLASRGDNLVLLLDDTREPHATVRALTPYFDAVVRGDSVVLRRAGSAVATRRLWTLFGWRGGWPADTLR